MTHHTIVKKKLHLRFKRSDGGINILSIARPKDKLKKVAPNMAMESIVEANLFEKGGVHLYEGRREACYKTLRVDMFL